jgi:hypothetical protein
VNPSTIGSRLESWPTPRAANGYIDEPLDVWETRRRRKEAEGINLQKPLTIAVKQEQWATTSASNPNEGETLESWNARQIKNKAKHNNGNGAGVPLAIQIKQQNQWATPRTKDAEGWMMNQARLAEGKPEDTLTGQALNSNKNNGKLNPQWVCVLMNLPVFWVKP